MRAKYGFGEYYEERRGATVVDVEGQVRGYCGGDEGSGRFGRPPGGVSAAGVQVGDGQRAGGVRAARVLQRPLAVAASGTHNNTSYGPIRILVGCDCRPRLAFCCTSAGTP